MKNAAIKPPTTTMRGRTIAATRTPSPEFDSEFNSEFHEEVKVKKSYVSP
jgi:hypothetical protein